MRLAIGPPNRHRKPTRATKSVGSSPIYSTKAWNIWMTHLVQIQEHLPHWQGKASLHLQLRENSWHSTAQGPWNPRLQWWMHWTESFDTKDVSLKVVHPRLSPISVLIQSYWVKIRNSHDLKTQSDRFQVLLCFGYCLNSLRSISSSYLNIHTISSHC